MNVPNVRKWPDGSLIRRADIEAEGMLWSEVLLYTEPVDDSEIPVEIPARKNAMRPDEIALFASKTLKKAEDVVATEGGVEATKFEGVFWVKSLRPEQIDRYRVQVGDDRSWATCTCTNGKTNMGLPRCYHLAAVLMVLEEGANK